MIESKVEDPPLPPPQTRNLEPADDGFEIVIRPRPGWIAIDWKEILAFRELLVFLVWRDITVRYKQTVLGSVWAILRPLLMMLIFTFIFGRIGKFDPHGFPYPVFVFAGQIPWTLFSQGLAQSALSLVNQQQLLTKVYFPRLFVPVGAASVFLVDLAYSLVVYGFILLYYGIVPSWTCIALVMLIPLTLVTTLGFGLILSALTIFYRDFRHIVPFLVQILLYLSPVIYAVDPKKISVLHHAIWALNPMVGIIEGYRSAILGMPWSWTTLGVSTCSAVAMFLFGVFYFRRTERLFADFA